MPTSSAFIAATTSGSPLCASASPTSWPQLEWIVLDEISGETPVLANLGSGPAYKLIEDDQTPIDPQVRRLLRGTAASRADQILPVDPAWTNKNISALLAILDDLPGEATALVVWVGVLGGLFVVLAPAGALGYYRLERAEQRIAHDLRGQIAGRVVDERGGTDELARTGEVLSLSTSDAARVGDVRRGGRGCGVGGRGAGGGCGLPAGGLVGAGARGPDRPAGRGVCRAADRAAADRAQPQRAGGGRARGGGGDRSGAGVAGAQGPGGRSGGRGALPCGQRPGA